MRIGAQNNTQENHVIVVHRLTKAYGGVTALKDMSFSLPAGCIAGIVGPNGAGKTTLFDVLTGMASADAGTVDYKGRRISGLSIEELGRIGIVRTFQDGSVPADLTVDEYLGLSATTWVHGAFGERSNQLNQWREEILKEAAAHLSPIRLLRSRRRLCSELSAGEQKFLVALRAVLRHPDLLLLDEPTQNFASDWVLILALWLKKLRDRGVTALLVSHDMPFAKGVCDRILRMANGQLQVGTDVPEAAATITGHRRAPRPVSEASRAAPLLSVQGLTAEINGFAIVQDVSFDVRGGDVIGITGPNGSGKTTLLRAVLGLGNRSKGRILLEQCEKTDLPPHLLSRAGVSLVLQGARLASRLTVEEALEVCWNLGAAARGGLARFEDDPWAQFKRFSDIYERFPHLELRRNTRAGVLSAGEQQLLAIALAIVRRPRILLLDEPSVGLHPAVLASLFQWVSELAQAGLGVVIVEQRIPELESVATAMFQLSTGSLYKTMPSDLPDYWMKTLPGVECSRPLGGFDE